MRYDAKITSLSEEGIFLSAGREGMRVGHGFYEIRLNALSSCCHPVARAYTNTGKDFLSFYACAELCIEETLLGEKSGTVLVMVLAFAGESTLTLLEEKSKNEINKEHTHTSVHSSTCI